MRYWMRWNEYKYILVILHSVIITQLNTLSFNTFELEAPMVLCYALWQH